MSDLTVARLSRGYGDSMAPGRPVNLPRVVDPLPSGRCRVRVTDRGETSSLGAFDSLGDAKAALAVARSERA